MTLPLAVSGIALSGAALGLSLRHDVDESAHLELGAEFPAVVQVGGLATGVLVAPDWVLTVAHAPELLRRMRPDDPLVVSFEGEQFEVARVVIPEEREAEPELHDLALLQLAEPVPDGIAPLPLWTEEPEPGTEFALVGWGVLASGDRGVELSPETMASPTRARRAGWNVLDRFEEESSRLFADFDGPGDALDLEASPCIGDSGGPALVRIEGEQGADPVWHVVGVIALIDDGDDDRIVGEYGEEFGMTAVLGYLEWIEATIGG